MTLGGKWFTGCNMFCEWEMSLGTFSTSSWELEVYGVP